MNRNISALFLPISLAGLVLMHCSNPSEPDDVNYSALPRQLTPEEIELAASADRFGLKLFREVVQQDADKNIFVSPLSVSMALGMTANGAADSTLAAMRTTLELADLDEGESNVAYQSLIELLTGADPKVQFDIANSIWYRNIWTFNNDFLQRCQDYFEAVVQGLDFSDPGAADVINAWVKENTQGKIEEIVGKPIDPLTAMFLINALYFNGTWTYEFDPVDTEDDEFTRMDGSKVACRMMSQEADLLYLETGQFQAVDLPYGDGLFSMTVLLPKPEVNLDDLVADLTPENWSLWISGLDSHAVQLELPKIKLSYDLTMNDVLMALGMGVAFDPGQADFTRMLVEGEEYPGNLYIYQVKHKTFVQVDEEGTEAAAVTMVEIGFTSIGPNSIVMRVDRPFIFVIRERTSGTLLFMGKIVEPVWEETS
ncbi:MAG: serpin family protein [Fidelibacterota bacterium]|nr:MAG: serpin family protein [Candidatus Neomarinimicrobiota bacterium]